MKFRVLFGLTTLILAACGPEPVGDSSLSQTEIDKSPHSSSAEDSSAWKLTDSKSAIDGRVVEATRVFSWPSQPSYIEASMRCNGGQNVTLSFQSNLENGDASPLVVEQKLLVESLIPTQYLAPTGRIKFGSDPAQDLSDFFVVEKYNNEARLILGDDALALHKAAKLKVDASAYAMRPAEKYWNDAAILRQVLPIAIELSDSTGSHEIVLDRNEQILAVIDACGGDGVVFHQGKLNEDMTALDAATSEHTGASEEKSETRQTDGDNINELVRDALERDLASGGPEGAKITKITEISENSPNEISVEFVWSLDSKEFNCSASVERNSTDGTLDATIPYVCYRPYIDG